MPSRKGGRETNGGHRPCLRKGARRKGVRGNETLLSVISQCWAQPLDLVKGGREKLQRGDLGGTDSIRLYESS